MSRTLKPIDSRTVMVAITPEVRRWLQDTKTRNSLLGAEPTEPQPINTKTLDGKSSAEIIRIVNAHQEAVAAYHLALSSWQNGSVYGRRFYDAITTGEQNMAEQASKYAAERAAQEADKNKAAQAAAHAAAVAQDSKESSAAVAESK